MEWLQKHAHWHGAVVDVSSAGAKSFIGMKHAQGRGSLLAVVEAIHFPPAPAIFRLVITHAVMTDDCASARPRAKLRGIDALTNVRKDQAAASTLLVDISHVNILLALNAVEPPVRERDLSGSAMYLISPISVSIGARDGTRVRVLGGFDANDEVSAVAYLCGA
jgi:hypothetical protein